ncbi:hypothetical protein Hanom_Chr10g00958121 [Helianthus anomalus]
MVSQYGTPPVSSHEEKGNEEVHAHILDDAFKEFEDCMEKIKNTMSEALKVHPNSDLILKRKIQWIGIVRKHLKDVAADAEEMLCQKKHPHLSRTLDC